SCCPAGANAPATTTPRCSAGPGCVWCRSGTPTPATESSKPSPQRPPPELRGFPRPTTGPGPRPISCAVAGTGAVPTECTVVGDGAGVLVRSEGGSGPGFRGFWPSAGLSAEPAPPATSPRPPPHPYRPNRAPQEL